MTALLLSLEPAADAQADRFGIPSCSGPGQELAVRESFVLCHSASLKVPVWAAYEITAQSLHGTAVRPRHFPRDAALASEGASDSDYRGSGYTRGHMVPAADAAWSEAAIRDTFLLSNAVPQVAEVNSGKWGQLARRVRALAEGAEAVYVFTGPIFEDGVVERIGRGQVAVPSHTYKVVMVIRGGEKTMYAAIVPNAANMREPLERYTVSVNEVQRRTGLVFFDALERSEQLGLESSRNSFSVPGLVVAR